MSSHKQALTLSLVIPAYNEENHLRDCLDAVAKQTIMPDEVIVVDNNSTDKTVEVAKKYPFVRVVSESQQGIVYARDKGMDSAKSDIIGRIDADTVMPPGWVEHVKEFYEHDKNDNCAWSGGAYFYNVRAAWLTGVSQSILVFRLNQLVLGYSVTWGSNMALPRKLWEAVRGEVCHVADIHEDIDLSIHLHKQGYRTYYDPHFKVGVKLRRVRSNRDKLWGSLQWWPRTLRQHGYKGWVLTWAIGVWLIYSLSFIPSLLEVLAKALGKSPIHEEEPIRSKFL